MDRTSVESCVPEKIITTQLDTEKKGGDPSQREKNPTLSLTVREGTDRVLTERDPQGSLGNDPPSLPEVRRPVPLMYSLTVSHRGPLTLTLILVLRASSSAGPPLEFIGLCRHTNPTLQIGETLPIVVRSTLQVVFIVHQCTHTRDRFTGLGGRPIEGYINQILIVLWSCNYICFLTRSCRSVSDYFLCTHIHVHMQFLLN